MSRNCTDFCNSGYSPFGQKSLSVITSKYPLYKVKEEFDIVIYEQDLRRLIHAFCTPQQFMDTLFDIDANLQVLKTFSLYSGVDVSGFMQLKTFKIEQVEFDSAALSGTMSCKLVLSYYYRSTDSEVLKDETVNWEYQVDNENKHVRFYIPY